MKWLRISVFLSLVTAAVLLRANDTKPPATPPATVSNLSIPMTKETRMDLIRNFNAELVYIRTAFPMGKKGLTLKNGVVTPSGAELQQMMAMWGPATKPGDRAQITNIVIRDSYIHFEINGGPVKKQKWYQRVTISGVGGGTPIAPSDSNANPRGSYVDLVFDKFVPELSPQDLKDRLRPVFDFDAKTPVEAYLETVPPKIKEAIQNHHVLVGMNREMVTYAVGRAPKKIREHDGDVEYEEWIYGEPPKDVDFVRFVGDEVIRVETMKVDGTKLVRTEREVELPSEPSVARDDLGVRPADAPSLRRPGEDLPNDSPSRSPAGSVNQAPPMPPAPRPQDPTHPAPTPTDTPVPH